MIKNKVQTALKVQSMWQRCSLVGNKEPKKQTLQSTLLDSIKSLYLDGYLMEKIKTHAFQP